MALSQEEYKQELINNFVDAAAWKTVREMVQCLQHNIEWYGQRRVDGKTAFFWINLNEDIEKFRYLYAFVLSKKESENLYREIARNNYAWLMEQIIITEKQSISAGERLLSMAALRGSLEVVEVLCRYNIGINAPPPINHEEKIIPARAINKELIHAEGELPIEGKGELQIEDKGELQIEGKGELQIEGEGELQIEDRQIISEPLVLKIAYRAMRLNSFPLFCEQLALLMNIHKNPIYLNVVRVSHTASIEPTKLQQLSYYETLFKLLDILAREDVDFTLVDRYGNTMLHYLARCCDAERQEECDYYAALIRLLANKNYMNINAVNDHNHTALEVAIQFNNEQAAVILVEAGGAMAR